MNNIAIQWLALGNRACEARTDGSPPTIGTLVTRSVVACAGSSCVKNVNIGQFDAPYKRH